MNRYDFLSKLLKDNKYAAFHGSRSKRNKKETKWLGGNFEIVRNNSFYIFLDTCTWMNLATKGDFDNLIRLFDLHVELDCVLLTPDQLLIEWNRNKGKVIDSELNVINDIIKKTKGFRDKIVDEQEQKDLLTELISNAENFKAEQVESIGRQTISLFDEIIGLGIKIPTTNKIKFEAADIALQKRAPFHKDKNSIGDAVLFLSLISYLENLSPNTLYFITDNKSDFSESKEQPTKMHQDLINVANEKGITIKYFLSLNDALDEIFEEVTDKEYVEEYKKIYSASIKRCSICNDEVILDLHNFDGRGQKIFYKCTNESCNYIEETNEYHHEVIHDNIY